jgi:MYXO-CTERM domain-containing protein
MVCWVHSPGLSRRPWLCGPLVALACLLTDASAPAALIVQVQPASLTAAAGSTGNVLEVVLVNNTGAPTGPFDLAAFNVTLETPAEAGIAFTGADTGTAEPYLLTGNSFGFQFTNPSGPGTGDVSDIANNLDQVIPPASTFGLGRFFFDVDASSPGGTFTVTVGSATSLTDPSFLPLAFTATGGQVVVAAGPGAVPEPSTLAMGVVGLLLAGGAARWRRRRAGAS